MVFQGYQLWVSINTVLQISALSAHDTASDIFQAMLTKSLIFFSQFFTESKQQSKFESLTISTVTNIQTGKDLIMYLVFVINNYISYSKRLSSTLSTKDHILHLIIVLVLYRQSFCFI